MTLNSISQPMLAGLLRKILRISDGKLREKGKLNFKVASIRAHKILQLKFTAS